MWTRAFLVMTLALGAASCADEDDDLQIDQVVPVRAAPGTLVEVTGVGFCGGEPDCRPPGFVSLGDRMSVVRDDAVSWLDTELRIEIPDSTATGAGWLVVTVAGRASNPVAFEIVDRVGAGADR